MSIMDKIFGGFGASAPAPNTQPAQQVNPGNIPSGAGATDSSNTTVPPGTVQTSQESPLANFADLWKPVENAQTPEAMFANVDPAKLMEAAKKTDFSKAISPDQLEAIAGGGQEAVAAFASAMNSVAQTVYANSALATTKIVEQALAKAQQQYDAKIPGLIKRQTVSDTLRTENPMFSNPAVQPLISALEAQLAVKNPNATANELTSMAKQYLEGVSTVFSNPKQGQESTTNAGDTDWLKFLS